VKKSESKAKPVKRAKVTSEKGGQVKSVVGVKKSDGDLLFQAKTLDGKKVTLSRSALREQNPSALLGFIETLLKE
jgi:hypothetical protein